MTKDKISCYGLAHLAQIKTSAPFPHPPLYLSFFLSFSFFPSCVILHVLRSLLFVCTIIRGKGFSIHYIHSLPIFQNTTQQCGTTRSQILKALISHSLQSTTLCLPLFSSSFLYSLHSS